MSGDVVDNSGGSALGTLVLLTSIGIDRDSWQWLDLPTEMPVAMPEHPGHGSRPPAEGRYGLDELADRIVAEVPGPLHLAGVSMGGIVAQHAALRHPDRVRSMMLAGTGASADAETMEERALAAERDGMAARIEGIMPRWFTPETLAAEPEHPGVRYVRETLLKLDPRAFANAWRAIGTHDVRDRLGELRLPTTCVAGAHDPAAPPERLGILVDGIAGARSVVIEDAAHMMQLERPEAFSAALHEHLSFAGAL